MKIPSLLPSQHLVLHYGVYKTSVNLQFTEDGVQLVIAVFQISYDEKQNEIQM